MKHFSKDPNIKKVFYWKYAWTIFVGLLEFQYVVHQILLVDVTVLILRENVDYKKSILILS